MPGKWAIASGARGAGTVSGLWVRELLRGRVVEPEFADWAGFWCRI